MPEVIVQATAEVCFNAARVLLNDVNQQLWSDAVLMPMLQTAHLELQAKLKARAAPVMKTWVDLIIPAYSITIEDEVPDLNLPIKFWEHPVGSPSSTFQPMTEAQVLPLIPTETNTSLVYWCWMQDIVVFPGASLDTEIVMLYWKRLPVPTLPTDPIGIIDGEQYLGPRVAAIAAASVGEENTSSALNDLAAVQLTMVMVANRTRALPTSGAALRP